MKENLIDILKYCARTDSDCTQCSRWTLDCEMKCVDDLLLSAAIALEEKQATSNESKQWIPVAERLPNAHDSCIVYRKNTFCHFSMLRYTPALGFHFYDSEWGNVTVDNVTHWMPLPEPPVNV